MIEPQSLKTAKKVEKDWGYEIWLTNNDRYCAKILALLPGAKSSLHYHPQKDETMLVFTGTASIETCEPGKCEATVGYKLGPGDFIRLSPGTPHRLSALGQFPAIIAEFSTPHSDDDVERLEPSQSPPSPTQPVIDLVPDSE